MPEALKNGCQNCLFFLVVFSRSWLHFGSILEPKWPPGMQKSTILRENNYVRHFFSLQKTCSLLASLFSSILDGFWMAFGSILDGFGWIWAPFGTKDGSRSEPKALNWMYIHICICIYIYHSVRHEPAENHAENHAENSPRTRQEHNRTQTPTAKRPAPERGAAVSPLKGELN